MNRIIFEFLDAIAFIKRLFSSSNGCDSTENIVSCVAEPSLLGQIFSFFKSLSLIAEDISFLVSLLLALGGLLAYLVVVACV